MPKPRLRYSDLPSAVRAAVEKHLGAVTSVAMAGRGGVIPVRSGAGEFVLTAQQMHHGELNTHNREAAIALYVWDFSPALTSRVCADGWDVLIFEAVSGRPANYRPGSPDLPDVAALLHRLSRRVCPDVDVRDARHFAREAIASPEALRWLRGHTLVHANPRPTNVIITADGPRLIDWSTATRGPAWLDTAFWALWLIAGGHGPDVTEHWASQVPAWRHAPPHAIDLFAALQRRNGRAGETANDRIIALRQAADSWYDYRRRSATSQARTPVRMN